MHDRRHARVTQRLAQHQVTGASQRVHGDQQAVLRAGGQQHLFGTRLQTRLPHPGSARLAVQRVAAVGRVVQHVGQHGRVRQVEQRRAHIGFLQLQVGLDDG
ncbi:hypothetical protein D3C87_1528940 [compost metagenome]